MYPCIFEHVRQSVTCLKILHYEDPMCRVIEVLVDQIKIELRATEILITKQPDQIRDELVELGKKKQDRDDSEESFRSLIAKKHLIDYVSRNEELY